MSQTLVDRYDRGADLLVYASSGLKMDQATAHPVPGAWSIAELVGHLLDCDGVFSVRMKHVLAEESPILQAFDESAWIARLGSNSIDVDEAVSLFVAGRRWMTRILRRRDDSDFARSGMHTERGRQTLAEIARYAANHVDHHLKFLYEKRDKLGISLDPRYTNE